MRARIGGCCLVFLSLWLLAAAPQAWALVVALPTGPVKVAQADLIVTGKVISTIDKAEATPLPQAKNKVSYTVAVIEVKEVLKGTAVGNKVRVGFLAAGPAVKPAGGTPIKLAVGQDGLFFLKKHDTGDFYVVPIASMFVPSQNKAAFEREVEDVRKALPVLADPLGSLKTDNTAKRLEAVAILIPVYRTAPLNAKFKQVDLAAEESKLLLKALLDADWDPNKYKGANFKQNPFILFNMLGLGPKDGFQDPKKGLFSPEFSTAARNWLTKNWKTYRLQKVEVTAAAAAPGRGTQKSVDGRATT